ncbi:GxxExxY protein [Pollutibacter soli]|uniref:GxxExxY protein n=1 Tax=Pollutibacter soli TaxID=3034157 RepID=UPI003013C824
MYILTPDEEAISKQVVDSACQVHKYVGPGFLEQVYETCFCEELFAEGLNFIRQYQVPIVYKGKKLFETLRLDILVENKIACELKALKQVNPLWEAQVLSHLKMTGLHVGFLINFNSVYIKSGIRRFCMK